MILCFKLSMPNNGSWNGKWTGQGRPYLKVVSFQGKRTEKAKAILAKGYFSYNFGDGWRAAIEVTKVEAKEASKLRRQSAGFCGYDWMVESIIDNLDIQVPKSSNA